MRKAINTQIASLLCGSLIIIGLQRYAFLPKQPNVFKVFLPKFFFFIPD